MLKYQFIRIDSQHASVEGILQMMSTEGVRLADRRLETSMPEEILRSIRVVRGDNKILILNQLLGPNAKIPPSVWRDQFPLCAIRRNFQGVSLLYLSEALVPGNWLLCVSGNEDAIVEEEFSEDHRSACDAYEYTVHLDMSEVGRWRTKRPAYVNLDRESDNIGGSSWDGNLVSWFSAGVTMRLQFGVQSGLFPSE